MNPQTFSPQPAVVRSGTEAHYDAYLMKNYARAAVTLENGGLITVNGFWLDYAKRDPKAPFLSKHLAEASRNFTEMMLAMAVLDIPFEPAKHETGAKDANDLMHRFYGGKLTRPQMAALSRLVDKAALAGDVVADGILSEAAQQLAGITLAETKLRLTADAHGKPDRDQTEEHNRQPRLIVKNEQLVDQPGQ